MHPIHFWGRWQAKNKCGRFNDVFFSKLTSCKKISTTQWSQYWKTYSKDDHTSQLIHSQQGSVFERESTSWSSIQVYIISSKLPKIWKYLHVILIIAEIRDQLYKHAFPRRFILRGPGSGCRWCLCLSYWTKAPNCPYCSQ